MREIFETNKIDLSLYDALTKQGISELTAVQVKTIPQAIKNLDLVVQSETGTGKTLAYLIPLFAKIDPNKREMQSIILVPTHELAMQIIKQIEFLSINSNIKATVTPIIGNVNIERQIDKLKEKPHIIVGTPGRVLELIKKRKIAAHTIKTIIIDEADTLSGDKNIEALKEIIKSTLKERQLLMFSASITRQTESRARELMKEPVFIKESSVNAVPDTIEHIYFHVEMRDKIETLRKVIGILKPEKALVFIGAREDADFLRTRLNYHGVKAEGLHGHSDKKDRKRIIEDFRSGKLPVLVVSDMAARGLDIEGLTHVFNYNAPEKSKDYLHRVGRTGRIGKKGMAVTLATEYEMQWIEQYKIDLKIKIARKEMFKGEIVNAKH